MCIYLFFYLFIYVYLFICLFISLFIFIYLFIYLFIYFLQHNKRLLSSDDTEKQLNFVNENKSSTPAPKRIASDGNFFFLSLHLFLKSVLLLHGIVYTEYANLLIW